MKRVLNIGEDYDFSLLGISCHAKDYRLFWEINRSLGIDLKKNSVGAEGMVSPGASYEDEDRQLYFLLLNNKIENGLLIPEYPQLDYFLRIEGPGHEEESADCRSKLIAVDMVLAVMELLPSGMKSKDNLIF